MFGAEDVDSYEGLRMQESVFGAKTIDGPDDWVFRYVHVMDSWSFRRVCGAHGGPDQVGHAL